jgi:hypothetical protein
MMLSNEVESALYECGRDRVFHRERTPELLAGVAVRLLSQKELAMRLPNLCGSIIGEGEDIDEAGADAARKYAAHLRELSKAAAELSTKLAAQAERIDGHLRR